MTAIATSSDLETFLGLASGSIDTTRATLMITLAQNEAETIVSPLPATAQGIVLAVAARAFANPASAHQASVGSASVSFGSPGAGTGTGGVWLTRSEKASLRRMAGGGSAFMIDTLPTGTSAVQLITVGGSPTGGTFLLSFVNQVTAPLAYNASAATLQAALGGLTAIGVGNVTVAGAAGGPWTVSFVADLATTPVPLIGADGSALTGGTQPTVVVTQTTAGVAKPGQGLPPWGFDYYDSGTPNQYVPGGFL